MSRRLLKGLRFREVGVHEKHGKLDDLWRDEIAVERLSEGKSGVETEVD